MLRGVFSGHIGAQAVTKEALMAEERGDFKGALDLYKEVLCGVLCVVTLLCDGWCDVVLFLCGGWHTSCVW